MKILVLASYFPKPHNPVMGVWALEQARAILKQGVEVTVLLPTPWIPKNGIPLVVIEHNLTDIQVGLSHNFRGKLYARVLQNADAVITVSERLANLMRPFLGTDRSKSIHIIRNGVDLA